ncbi:hypothetical protein D3C87_1192890 [compost metagenome]
MRATLRRQRHAGWRSDDHEAGILIAGIVQGIQSACDERVVDRANGQEPFPEERVGKTRGAQQKEQVHLGNAELDMLALRCELPFGRRGNLLIHERVGTSVPREQLSAIDPWAQICRSGHVR